MYLSPYRLLLHHILVDKILSFNFMGITSKSVKNLFQKCVKCETIPNFFHDHDKFTIITYLRVYNIFHYVLPPFKK